MLLIRTISAGVAASVLAFAASAHAAGVYVTDQNLSGSVYEYSQGPGGALSSLGTAATDGNASWGIAVSPDGKSVYVGETGGSLPGADIAQFDVQADGTLTKKSPADVPLSGATTPSQMVVSPDGTSLYVNDLGGNVFQFNVGAGGKLSPKTPASVSTSGVTCPVGIVESPDGHFVYVALNGCTSGGTIQQYAVASDGTLTLHASAPEGHRPSGMAISPDGASLYVANTDGTSTLSQFDVGPSGISAKTPATVATPTEIVSRVAMSPNGKNVYAIGSNANEMTPTVSEFSVGSGGALSSLTSIGAAYAGGGIAVSADGTSVYSAGDHLSAAGAVSEYTIGGGGVLSEISPGSMPAGKGAGELAVTPAPGGGGGNGGGNGGGGNGGGSGGGGSSLSTTTAVVCNYQFIGSAAFSDLCTATVGNGASSVPTGIVQFGSPGGSFPAGGQCTLARIQGAPTASCSVQFIPPPTVSPTITAHYLGDTHDNPSTGSTGLLLSQSTAAVIPSASISPSTIHAAGSGILCANLAPGISCVARAEKVGGIVKFTVRAPSVVVFTVQRPSPGRKRGKHGCVAQTPKSRKRAKCTRWTTLSGQFKITASKAGIYSFLFRGRIGGRKIKPGSYRLVATPYIATVRELPAYIPFRVGR